MKILLTKLLLALTLTINPLSVLAGAFHHHHEVKANDSGKALTCSFSNHQEYADQQERPDSEDCEPSCCEDAECATQEVCTGQQHSVFTSPIPLIFDHSNRNRGWNAHVFVVPERESPPEPPPPIHI